MIDYEKLTDAHLRAIADRDRGAFWEQLRRIRARVDQTPAANEHIEAARARLRDQAAQEGNRTMAAARSVFGLERQPETRKRFTSGNNRYMDINDFAESIEAHIGGPLDAFTHGMLLRWAAGRETVLGTILDAVVQAHPPTEGAPSISQVSAAVRKVYRGDAGRILRTVHR